MPTTRTDRKVLRELAAQVAEIAALPVQQETIALLEGAQRPASPCGRWS